MNSPPCTRPPNVIFVFVFVLCLRQVERERSEKNKALLEKEEYRAHIHKLARALKRHQVHLSAIQRVGAMGGKVCTYAQNHWGMSCFLV